MFYLNKNNTYDLLYLNRRTQFYKFYKMGNDASIDNAVNRTFDTADKSIEALSDHQRRKDHAEATKSQALALSEATTSQARAHAEATERQTRANYEASRR